jgi:hypothetical protein
MRLVFNPKRGSRWWLQESELEVHGMDIVRSESNPDEIVFKPRFGDAQIGDARLTRNVLALMSKVSESSVNNWLTGMAMTQLTGKSDIPKTTTELAARITEHAGLKLDTQADIIERLLAGMAPEHRDFVRQTLANTELSARVRIRPNERGEPIRFGNNQLTILGGEDIRIARAPACAWCKAPTRSTPTSRASSSPTSRPTTWACGRQTARATASRRARCGGSPSPATAS